MSYMAGNGAGGDLSGRGGGQLKASKNDNDSRKIFVGGLSWESTAEDLKAYFAKYGEVLDATLKIDITTGRSRGFGFVLFGDESSVDRVVSDRSHILHGKQIDPKRAVAGGTLTGSGVKKIFVGGLDQSNSEQDIIKVFSQYGNVVQVELPFDRTKNVRRAFAFVTFDSEDAVNQLCANPKVPFGDKMVDIRKATTKDQLQQQNGGARGGRGGGMMMRGGRGGPMGPVGYPMHGGPPGGYDYNGGYPAPAYGGYDAYGGPAQPSYGAYGAPPSGAYGAYGAQPAQGWGGGYEASAAPAYGQPAADPYGGYDYSAGWQEDPSAYGKAKRGGGAGAAQGYGAPAATPAAPAGYHPYSR